MNTQEKIYDVFWEGPFSWDERGDKVKPHQVLYQIYGHHPVYGSNILLYIGMTEKGIQRLEQHESWVCDECDTMSFRLGSLGDFISWKEWNEPGDYEPAKREIVEEIEALLIDAHSPAYNSSNKNTSIPADTVNYCQK
jgi:hypothetical protein